MIRAATARNEENRNTLRRDASEWQIGAEREDRQELLVKLQPDFDDCDELQPKRLMRRGCTRRAGFFFFSPIRVIRVYPRFSSL
jgi:hypothetical protein